MPSEARRLHPLSFLFGLVSGLRKFALPGILVLIAGRAGSDNDDWEKWQVWAMAFVIPYALYALGRYLTLTYRLEPNEIVIRTGLLFRNERHVPYARIQNLDGEQNVLHRLLKVVEVRVDTGAGKEPEATLAVLPLADFEEMRRRVFAGRSGTAAPAEDAPPAQARTLLHLGAPELVLAGLIENRGTVIVAAFFGLLWEIGLLGGLTESFFGDKVSGRGLLRSLARALFAGGGIPWGRIALTAAAFAAFLVFVRLVSMLWAWQRLHGFRLTRDGDDLRTEYGLLTRVVTTIPLHRIQALTIHEGPLLRLLGRVAVKAETAGGGGGEESGGDEGKKRREALAPILARDRLSAFVAEVLPGLDLGAVEWQPMPRRAFAREAKRRAILALAFSLPFLVPLKGWYPLLLAFFLAWAVVAAKKTVEHLGWAVTDRAVLFRSGWLWRRVSAVPFAKIQAVTLAESPFDRRAVMARLRVDTAGTGEAAHRVDIPYLPRATADGLGALLATQAARTSFRW